MDKTTREQRMGLDETRNPQMSFVTLLALTIVLMAILGLAGHADLIAKGLIN